MNEPIAVALVRTIVWVLTVNGMAKPNPDVFRVPPYYRPRGHQTPTSGAPSVRECYQEAYAHGNTCYPRTGPWVYDPWVDREIKKILPDGEAVSSREPPPRRVSWEERPRARNIINLTL